MEIEKMLDNQVIEMESEIVGIEDEIDKLKIRKETIHEQLIKLKTILAKLQNDGDNCD